MKDFIISRTKLRVKMVEERMLMKDLCSMLDITYAGLKHKFRGDNGFSESEIAILYSRFGPEIFLPSVAVEKTARKGGKRHDARRERVLPY